MSATYRSSSPSNTGATAASSLTVSLPSGYQPHDYLLAAISVDGNTSTISTPSGWTLMRDSVSAGANLHLALFWRLATGTESANYTWNFDSARAASGTIMAYSGANVFVPPAPSSTGTQSTTSAGTTLVGANVNSSYDTGMTLEIFATRNAVAVGTLTAGGSYTKRDDTSTTAGTFVGLCTQDLAKALPVGGTTASNNTTTQASTAICNAVFIEDARPAFSFMLIDEYAVQSATTSTTNFSVPVQTNLPNTLVLACIAINKDSATVSTVSSGVSDPQWTRIAQANTVAGCIEIWRAFYATPVSNLNVTTTFSAAVVSYNAAFFGITGADYSSGDGASAIGTVQVGSTTAAAPSLTIATTRNNSWVFAMANANVAGTMTAGSSQTLFRSQNDATNVCQSWMWRRTVYTPTAGTSVTLNSTSPSTANCNIIAVEIASTPRYTLGSLGVG